MFTDTGSARVGVGASDSLGNRLLVDARRLPQHQRGERHENSEPHADLKCREASGSELTSGVDRVIERIHVRIRSGMLLRWTNGEHRSMAIRVANVDSSG